MAFEALKVHNNFTFFGSLMVICGTCVSILFIALQFQLDKATDGDDFEANVLVT